MDEINEEVYSTIFNALRHGVRRNILRMLNKQELPFTTMEETLSLSSSHLTYHLDALKELVTKTENGYKLSVFGQAAVEMIEKVEDPPQEHDKRSLKYKQISTILLAITLLTSGLFGYSQIQLNTLRTTQTYQINQIKTLTEKLERAHLDLSDYHSVKTAIISYLVNRVNEPNDPIKIINQETLESDYKISIELGAIREVNETSLDNQTPSLQMRFFTASFIDNSEPNNITYLTGWIDENRRVQASNWIWFDIVRGRNSTLPNMWIPFLDDEYCINKFLETTSEDGFEYWNVTIGPVKVSDLTESEGKSIRTFSAYTMWLNSTVYWPYAGYITEDREIYYIRID